MIELPEAAVLAAQIEKSISGKRIKAVTSAHTPHKLAGFYGRKEDYPKLVVGRMVARVRSYGSFVEIEAGDARILFGEGCSVRFHEPGEPRAEKHQLQFEFADGSALSVWVQMYGGMGCFRAGELDNPYYKVAREKPSPLSAEFDRAYFDRLADDPKVENLSLKAFLATGQRIPGLGNGVLQDILFEAGLHPRRKVASLSAAETKALFGSVKKTLKAMAGKGGRDTESDLRGRSGGYKTKLSKNTGGKPCAVCGSAIKKEAYLGGSVYYCPKCQGT